MITTKDSTPACTKASTMVVPDWRIEIGAPVASGATFITALENALSAAFVPEVSLGNTWMRAVPSFATQSRTISGGIVATVTATPAMTTPSGTAWC